jgi:hypothetical protein
VNGTIKMQISNFLPLTLAGCVYFVNCAHAESFVAPSSGTLYVECIGGSAGATSQFGTGTSPSSFVALLSGLPQSCPTSEVVEGAVVAGQTVPFAIYTFWNGQYYWAFSTSTDQASYVAFTDVNDSLGMGGNIIQQTSATTWIMHLNDAAHYTISTAEANNILIQLRLAPSASPAPSTTGPCTTATVSGGYSYGVNGTLFAGASGPAGFYSVVGVLTADGKGNLSGTDSISENGTVQTDRTFTGTYTIQGNCSGTASLNYSGGQVVNFVIAVSASGGQISFLQTSAGAVAAGTATLQTIPLSRVVVGGR